MTFTGDYNIVNEEGVLTLLAELGLQTSDTYDDKELEKVMLPWLQAHTRPGCDCDDCTDETCPEADSDFDHWSQ